MSYEGYLDMDCKMSYDEVRNQVIRHLAEYFKCEPILIHHKSDEELLASLCNGRTKAWDDLYNLSDAELMTRYEIYVRERFTGLEYHGSMSLLMAFEESINKILEKEVLDD